MPCHFSTEQNRTKTPSHIDGMFKSAEDRATLLGSVNHIKKRLIIWTQVLTLLPLGSSLPQLQIKKYLNGIGSAESWRLWI